MSERMTTAPSRREVLATLAILLGLLGVLGARWALRRFGPHPTPDRCAQMLQRYAEHEARAADLSERPAPSPPPVVSRASPAEIERCARDLTVDEVECAMRANNADELERCLP